jgi:uncharacterized protein HemY
VSAVQLGDHARARGCLEESLALAEAMGDERQVAFTCDLMAYYPGPYDDGRRQRLAERVLALAQHRGWSLGIALAHRILGDLALRRGDYAAARRAFAEDLARTRALKDTFGVIGALSHLGQVALLQGDYAGARAHYKESLALRREVGANPEGIAAGLRQPGEVGRGAGGLRRGPGPA